MTANICLYEAYAEDFMCELVFSQYLGTVLLWPDFVDEELGFVGMKRGSKSRSKVQNSKLIERVGPGAGWPDLSSGSNTSRHGVLGHIG